MNESIKKYAKSKQVKQWEIANKLNIHESKLSRMLRTPLSSKCEKKLYSIIDEISSRKKAEYSSSLNYLFESIRNSVSETMFTSSDLIVQNNQKNIIEKLDILEYKLDAIRNGEI